MGWFLVAAAWSPAWGPRPHLQHEESSAGLWLELQLPSRERDSVLKSCGGRVVGFVLLGALNPRSDTFLQDIQRDALIHLCALLCVCQADAALGLRAVLALHR